MRRALLLATLAVLAAPARADDFWSRGQAADADGPDAMARRNYEHAMEEGDNFSQLAIGRGTSSDQEAELLRQAVKQYDNAALAMPEEPEPRYRAGLILNRFFVSCVIDPRNGQPQFLWCLPGHPQVADAKHLVNEWQTFLHLRPLDPRVDFNFLFELAIASTQAAGDGVPEAEQHARIEAALGYYEAALQRVGLDSDVGRTNLAGNLAESYMMLGRLDEAIAQYQTAVRQSGEPGMIYGLAVALDRDEQGAKARELIVALGIDQFSAFQRNIFMGNTFFVPTGETFYYTALIHEALGQDEDAIVDWQLFIDSGAHPQFADRARANREALIKARGHKRPRPTLESPPEYESIP
jgi:tetratricopeptide (TPR) repeat protein